MGKIIGFFVEGILATLLLGPIGFGLWAAFWTIVFILEVLRAHAARIELATQRSQRHH